MTNKTKVIIGSVVGGVVLLGGIGALSNKDVSRDNTADFSQSTMSVYSASTAEQSKSKPAESSSEPKQSSATLEQSSVSTSSKVEQSSTTVKSSSSTSVSSSKAPVQSSSKPVQSSAPKSSKAPAQSSSKPAQSITYVLNTNTLKVHRKTCPSVKDIKPENYATTTDLDAAIRQGYTACKRCNPF